MTKEITKAIILQEIQNKFKLRDLYPEVFSFSEMVVPTYDLSSHLGTWEVATKTVSITSAMGFAFFTVPINEQWILRAYQIIYGATGAHKGSGLYIDGRPPGTAGFIYLDLKKGQDVSYLVNLPVPVLISPNSTVRYLIDEYTSTQNLRVDLDVWKETIR